MSAALTVQFASDLHLERLADEFPSYTGVTPHPDAEVLVLAGDIHNGGRAIALFADWPVPVVYVPGNHEFYGHDRMSVLSRLNQLAKGTSVHILHRNRWDYKGVRFLGATLWTDYKAGKDQTRAMQEARRLADHRVILEMLEPFTPDTALRLHRQDRSWLTRQLAQPFEGPTVVVTHHAPHLKSLEGAHKGDALNPAFASNLTSLVKKANLWIHGHVHSSFEYPVGGCTVACNPHGQVKGLAFADSPADFCRENEQYQAARIAVVSKNDAPAT